MRVIKQRIYNDKEDNSIDNDECDLTFCSVAGPFLLESAIELTHTIQIIKLLNTFQKCTIMATISYNSYSIMNTNINFTLKALTI